MQIVINGETQNVPDGLSVSQLIEHLELSQRRVAVEVNKAIVRRADHPNHELAAGDVIEIVTLVGGG